VLTYKRLGVVGSREFKNYSQLDLRVRELLETDDDEIISGGAVGADSMAQRFCKENGYDISIKYPKYKKYGKPATFIRNKLIAENSDLVVAFYQKGRFQQGGTSNTIKWARELEIPYLEFEEE